jgi:hypothetical protein
VLASAAALLAGLQLATPYVVRSRMFKERALALVADRIGARLDYSDLRLRLFPSPLLDIRDLSVTLPGGVAARSDTLSVAIHILPLFKGQLQLRELHLHIELGGEFEKGIFAFDTCSLDSPSLQMTCRGKVDVPNKEMEITILAAPLKTVDRIVKKLPVIGYVLGGTLISIPIKVEGPLDHPKVVPLSPEAVGKGTLEILKRTLQVPVKVLQPVTDAVE